MGKINRYLPTARAIYQDWKENSEGIAPIKLCVTYQRSRKYYTITHGAEKLFLDKSTWELVQDEKLKGGRRQRIVDIRTSINTAERWATSAFERTTKSHPFSWERFEAEFVQGDNGRGFLALFQKNIDGLRVEKRYGAATAYNTALIAFKSFRNDKELSAHEITPTLLKDFEKFLERGGHQEHRKQQGQKKLTVNGVNKTTIGVYMRALKVVYNLAADEDKTLLENYPFARRQNERNKYKIRTGSGHKGDVLTIDQLQKFASLTMEGQHEEARLLWLFSFHAQGMNIRDIAQLRYKDIDDGIIRYVRHKTRDTESKEELMQIPLSTELQSIIAKIGNADKRPNSYVFTIVPNGLAMPHRKNKLEVSQEERIGRIIQQKTKNINTLLNEICEAENTKLKKGEGVKLPAITTYWARHSYANLLRATGQSIDFIKDALGHSSEQTTRNYVRRFDNEEMKKANELIQKLIKAQ